MPGIPRTKRNKGPELGFELRPVEEFKPKANKKSHDVAQSKLAAKQPQGKGVAAVSLDARVEIAPKQAPVADKKAPVAVPSFFDNEEDDQANFDKNLEDHRVMKAAAVQAPKVDDIFEVDDDENLFKGLANARKAQQMNQLVEARVEQMNAQIAAAQVKKPVSANGELLERRRAMEEEEQRMMAQYIIDGVREFKEEKAVKKQQQLERQAQWQAEAEQRKEAFEVQKKEAMQGVAELNRIHQAELANKAKKEAAADAADAEQARVRRPDVEEARAQQAQNRATLCKKYVRERNEKPEMVDASYEIVGKHVEAHDRAIEFLNDYDKYVDVNIGNTVDVFDRIVHLPDADIIIQAMQDRMDAIEKIQESIGTIRVTMDSFKQVMEGLRQGLRFEVAIDQETIGQYNSALNLKNELKNIDGFDELRVYDYDSGKERKLSDIVAELENLHKDILEIGRIKSQSSFERWRNEIWTQLSHLMDRFLHRLTYWWTPPEQV